MSLPTLSIADSVPTTHLFKHSRVDTDFARWDVPATEQFIARDRLSFWIKRPVGNSKVANRNMKLHVLLERPVLEVVSNDTVTGIAPAPTLAYTNKVEVIYTIADRSSLLERVDLRTMLRTLTSIVDYQAFVDNATVPS